MNDKFLRNWADVGDNRFGPILRELVDTITDCEDPEKLRCIANRLKFMSSSIHSYRRQLEKELSAEGCTGRD